MMANERLSVFDTAADVDLSSFTPKSDAKQPKPGRETVKAITEAARFPSRQGTPQADVALKRAPRYHKTGRTAQLNCRVMPASLDKVYAIADEQNWLVGETIERALEALERELKGETRDS